MTESGGAISGGILRRMSAGVAVWAVIRLAWVAAPRLFLLLAAMATIIALLPPFTLFLVQQLVDGLTGDAAWPVPLAMGAIALSVVVRSTGDGVVSVKQQELAALVGIVAEQRLLQVVGTAPLSRFFHSGWLDAVARAREGVTWRPALATGTVLTLIGYAAAASGLVVLIGSFDGTLLLLALGAAIPVLLYRRYEIRTLYEVRRGSTGLERRRDDLFHTLLRTNLAKEIRGYGLAAHFASRHRDLGQAVLDRERAVHTRTILRAVVAGVVSALFLGAAYLQVGQPSPDVRTGGTLFLAFVAFGTLTDGLAGLFAVFADLEEHAAYLTDYRRLVEVRDGDRPQQAPGSGVEPASRREAPRLEFRGVTFRYDDGTLGVDGLSFLVEPGEIVSLMGANGAGKSTVISLALGLLAPDSGSVLLDGHDLRDVSEEYRRSLSGALFQEYGQYEATIAESVWLGRVDDPPDREAIENALARASLAPLVEGLPSRAETPVGRLFPGSRDLSVGQWQRLALARMLYRDAPFWALDEPTAALDSIAEVDFLRQLRSRHGRRTILIVTHRLETAALSDRVLVLEGGRLAEEGRPDDLLRRDGLYAGFHRALSNAIQELRDTSSVDG